MDFEGRKARIGVGVGITVAAGEFTYIKPYIYLEVDALESDNIDTLYDEIAAHTMEELKVLAEDLKEIMC